MSENAAPKPRLAPPAAGKHATIGDLAQSRDNNFNLLRFVAASAVLLSHCWPLTLGSNESEPMARIFPGLTLGTTAVIVFFSISGFLVASSWDRSRSASEFLIARCLRIFPGLLVMLLVSVLALGALMTKYPIGTYLVRWDTWTYVPSNLLLAKGQLTLPGVLDGAQYGVLNGSLWTLAYEFACYLALLLAALAGGLTRTTFAKTLVVFVLIGLALAQLPGADTKGFANKVLLLGPAFLVGTAAWAWRNDIPLSGVAAVLLAGAAAAARAGGLPLAHVLFSVAVAYGALYIALVPRGVVREFNRAGDCSYGMYIYAFPIQQLTHFYLPQLGVAGLFAIAFCVTLPLAALSWMFVEQPAMEWGKKVIGQRRLALARQSSS